MDAHPHDLHADAQQDEGEQPDHHIGAIGAKQALDVFPAGPAKDALLDVVDFCIARVR